MRRLMTGLVVALLLSPAVLAPACSIGSTTSDRPAITLPAIGPDGVVWDAFLAAKREDTKAFRFSLSERFIHSHILPENERAETTNESAFFDEEAKLRAEFLPKYKVVVNRLLKGWMKLLRKYGKDRMLETSKPRYEIRFKDSWGSAKGPNLAFVTLSFHDIRQPKTENSSVAKEDAPVLEEGELPPPPKPAFELVLRLVQSGRHWLIDGFEPDELMGAFSR